MRVEEVHYLFVYGTLRTGFGSPVRQEIKADVELIGDAVTRGKLYDIGRYPGAVRIADNESGTIRGEVLRLRYPKKVLRILDQYEGYDPEMPAKSEYYRDQEPVRLSDGKEISAWVYWYNFPIEGKRRIRQSDYLQYLKKKQSN